VVDNHREDTEAAQQIEARIAAYGRRNVAASPEYGIKCSQDAVERLLLVYEELGSNALRHGRGPVRMVLTAFDRYWLLVVSDAAADVPPLPATDRDAAEGGLGLYLVARVCGAHGWTQGEDGRKHVWAQIDHTRTEVQPEVLQSLPRPRAPRSRRSQDR